MAAKGLSFARPPHGQGVRSISGCRSHHSQAAEGRRPGQGGGRPRERGKAAVPFPRLAPRLSESSSGRGPRPTRLDCAGGLGPAPAPDPRVQTPSLERSDGCPGPSGASGSQGRAGAPSAAAATSSLAGPRHPAPPSPGAALGPRRAPAAPETRGPSPGPSPARVVAVGPRGRGEGARFTQSLPGCRPCPRRARGRRVLACLPRELAQAPARAPRLPPLPPLPPPL